MKAEQPIGVLIIAMDKDDFVTLVRERRMRRRDEPDVWTLPAGVTGPKESAEKAAARVLLEKSGLAGDVTFFVKRYQPSASTSDLRCYIAKKAKSKGEPFASVEVKTVPLFEAVQLALEGSIQTDFAALCLLRYAYRSNRVEVLEKELDPRLRYD